MSVRLIEDCSIPDTNFDKISKDRTDVIKQWAKNLSSQKIPLVMIMANNHFEGLVLQL
ncbi:MAG: hypothetical protein OEM18_06275 [Nitrosopumilus sp.]|nr:hypothetical protein [Nitrosopumilus sp.]MDH3502680.1 hypothetical protein [Nitrosopumilus sp.]